MIRPITLDDMDYLFEQGGAYLTESGDDRFFTLDEAKFRERVSEIICSPLAVGFIAPGKGHIAATISPSIWGEMPVTRVFTWWVVPKFRGGPTALRLLKTMERSALGLLLIDSHHHLNAARVGAMYERNGYEPIQTLYAKAL